MALFKKTFTTSETKSLFPKPVQAAPAILNESQDCLSIDEMTGRLLGNKEFMDHICDLVTEKLLTILCEQYNFSPTDKYLEEVSNRKKYIGQLDSYLQERREINATIESELQTFLQETSANLSKALDMFTLSIQNRIKQADEYHGIDSKSRFVTANDVKAAT